jgi:alpha-L-fucosidase 2
MNLPDFLKIHSLSNGCFSIIIFPDKEFMHMKSSWYIVLLLGFLMFSCNTYKQEYAGHRLWYDEPADASVPDSRNGWQDDPEWLKALPLGNGSLGVMVFGDVNRERVQLNEESMWSGSPDDNNNPDAHRYLGEIRELLFKGAYGEASELTKRTQVCIGPGTGFGNGAQIPFGCFQTLGDLWIDMHKKTGYSGYHRELNLEDAVARVRYSQDGVNFSREIFISYPHQVMVARFVSDTPGQLSFSCTMTRPERYTTKSLDDQLVMSGVLTDGKGGDGLEYLARLKAITKQGNLEYRNDSLVVKGADEVILLLAASTNYTMEYPDYNGRNHDSITQAALEQASTIAYEDLLDVHIRDYREYFSRVTFDLDFPEPDTIPTDTRIKRVRNGEYDPHLEELVFHYGRYLLISSSRQGTLPANLQGIWANKIQTPWNGDYHTDVNVEMNYWLAGPTNLAEMHLPLFKLITALTKPGTVTASVQYGAGGWVVHPVTNVWGYTAPGESAEWGMHTGAAAWICQHIGEHFRFTSDTLFLSSMYPVLSGAVEFYLDWLVEHPRTGKLVSGPAVSPENTFIAPDGSLCQISMGPAHDQQVIWQLFDDFIMASGVLNKSGAHVDDVLKARERLDVTRVGTDGRLMEWAEEFPEHEPGHRHISHLFAVHPGSQINPVTTPELARAAMQSLDYRMSHGGGHTGWSAAWLISQYARLHHAEKAGESLDLLLRKSFYPNLFGSCPPFQMDSNFGVTAGITEMLLQSHVTDQEGRYLLHLLPALPDKWISGRVRGLRARGGFTVEISWSEGKLMEAYIGFSRDTECVVRYGNEQQVIRAKGGETFRISEEFIKELE